MTRRLRRRTRSRQALTSSRWSQASNRSGSRRPGRSRQARMRPPGPRRARAPVAEDQAGGRVQPRETRRRGATVKASCSPRLARSMRPRWSTVASDVGAATVVVLDRVWRPCRAKGSAGTETRPGHGGGALPARGRVASHGRAVERSTIRCRVDRTPVPLRRRTVRIDVPSGDHRGPDPRLRRRTSRPRCRTHRLARSVGCIRASRHQGHDRRRPSVDQRDASRRATRRGQSSDRRRRTAHRRRSRFVDDPAFAMNVDTSSRGVVPRGERDPRTRPATSATPSHAHVRTATGDEAADGRCRRRS